ncbi:MULTISPECIES: nucleopolyhedrovirus P10 family protein [Streptomyces]|uniref:Nucleopolyhedrovirus P10 family protein n=1 Tax=Streptomyces doebereineriae TaxID=3075528 RepID=A0ABU2V4X7_9ACTN|nr:nucleopolyhedrovirus P10 family protein [Streptomyces sp. DSM 41640]MDT0480448.1 nucleopolyhedrovirus P10 family protein [Streptomyces sp. DSM 41640]
MTAEQWARTVRHQLGLGRLLPLGGPRDGAWISEDAAQGVLRAAVRELPDVRLGGVRIGLADPEDTHEPAVPPPPSALPPGPLRVTAEFEATPARPLPVTAERLRTALAGAAERLLGLELGEVDLRVTALVDEDAERSPVRQPEPPRAVEAGPGDEALAAGAALSVSGVDRLTGLLGRPVHIADRETGDGSLPRRHVRVELSVGADRRALDVAREVRAAVGEVLSDRPTVAVLVTGVAD